MIETIFALYYKSMLRVAYQYVNDKDRAEDIVQEVFERLAKYALDIGNPYSMKTRYLIKIMVRNASLTFLGKENRIQTAPFHEESYNEEGYADPERLYFEKSDYQRIINYIEHMDPRSCDAMKLKYGLGLSTEKIAEILGVNVMLTRYRIQRGRVLLRQALEKEERDKERAKQEGDLLLQERRAAKEVVKEKMILQTPE